MIVVVLFSVSGAGKGKVKGGAATIIEPIPIIFGTDRKTLKTFLLFSIVVKVMLMVFMVLYYLLLR